MKDTVFDPILGKLRTADKPQYITSGGTTITQTVAGVSVQTGTAHPATGSDGDIFYDTDDGVLYIYANGMWNAISGGAPPAGLTGQMIGTGPVFGITYS